MKSTSSRHDILIYSLMLFFCAHLAGHIPTPLISPYGQFSAIYSKIIQPEEHIAPAIGQPSTFVWEKNTSSPFNELIFSWNGFRPEKGSITFWVSVNHVGWSSWHRIAEWTPKRQRTFVNKKHHTVHTKNVRVEMQRGQRAQGFRIKAVFKDGAQPENLKALFACTSDLQKFRIVQPPSTLPSIMVDGVPRQSQMVVDHPRYQDLCSPTCASMLVHYFERKFSEQKSNAPIHNYVKDFANKVHDHGINIYGNWLLNVAQAYDASGGNVLYKVGRLNTFHDLYKHLSQGIPIAVSVRSLPGGATPYKNGHFMVVIGWNKERKTVVCIDPAFGKNRATLKNYAIKPFLRAWARSHNLAYIPSPLW